MTRWPRANRSRMNGWLNQSARRKPPAVPRIKHAEHAPPGAGAAKFVLLDDAGDALELALFEVVDRAELGQVLIIAREEEQHVGHGAEAEPFEQFRPMRSHAGHELHGRGKLLCGSLFRRVHHAVIVHGQ